MAEPLTLKPVSTAVDRMSMVRTARICGSSISKESQPEAPHLGSVGLDGEFLHLVGLGPSCLKPSLKGLESFGANLTLGLMLVGASYVELTKIEHKYSGQ